MTDEILETDPESVVAYALHDAFDLLDGTQIQEWQDNGKTWRAKRYHLENWIDREATDKEWSLYKDAYERAMQAGVSVLKSAKIDDTWDTDAESSCLMEAIEAAGIATKSLLG